MLIRYNRFTDPDAADVGAMAFLTMVEAHRLWGTTIPTELDSRFFSVLWEKDGIHIFTATEGTEIIGCRVAVCAPSVFNQSLMTASTVSLFVVPQHRRNGVGRQLLLQGDNHLRTLGVRLIMCPVSEGSAALTQTSGYSKRFISMEKSYV